MAFASSEVRMPVEPYHSLKTGAMVDALPDDSCAESVLGLAVPVLVIYDWVK